LSSRYSQLLISKNGLVPEARRTIKKYKSIHFGISAHRPAKEKESLLYLLSTFKHKNGFTWKQGMF